MHPAPFVRILAVGVLAVVTSAHVGSPDVFFAGNAGPYEVRVVVRPPQVVPGVARVNVRAPVDVERVSIRPVYWRAGSKGAPSADETRRLEGQSGTFEGSLWLMARGAYTVDVAVTGSRGIGSVLVPVASVATGRLAMSPMLAVLLAVLGLVLCAGLVNIVYKGAGESLVGAAGDLDPSRRRSARRVAAFAVPIVGLALFGGARWWGNVDADYQRTMYRPSPLILSLDRTELRLQASDTVWQVGRPSGLVPDHGKLMHLFLVRSGDARAFAHLHPLALDSSPNPRFRATLPELPGGPYHVFGDVVHETGFERTLVGTLTVPSAPTPVVPRKSDPDDAWYTGDASTSRSTRLSDGSTMELELGRDGAIVAGEDATLRVRVRDPRGEIAMLEPYLGMRAHGVVVRTDGQVFVHLHPMGTITVASQQAFMARDRGDTTANGRVTLDTTHGTHASATSSAGDLSDAVEFPYEFPRSGDYRLFVQVKRDGTILTGAFALTVGEPVDGKR